MATTSRSSRGAPEVYCAARRRNPNRWSRSTRNWTPIATVRLNPEHGLSS
jgi:hypothetical protein